MNFRGTPLIIAIDGPAGAGKSTVAAALARELGLFYLDTGATYRAFSAWARREGVSPEDASGVDRLARDFEMEFGDNGHLLVRGWDATPELRLPDIGALASRFAALSPVRRVMVAWQRAMAHSKACVVEGRDIATVVLPDASVKFFVTASPEVRALRRAEQLSRRGIDADLPSIVAEITERDRRDSTREDSPLRITPESVLVDTSAASESETLHFLLATVRSVMEQPGRHV